MIALLGGAASAGSVMIVVGLSRLSLDLRHRHDVRQRLMPARASVDWAQFNPYSRFRARQRYERDLPVALDAMARSLGTGANLLGAMRDSAALPGDVARDLDIVVREIDAGRSVADALLVWRSRRSNDSVRLVTAALMLVVQTGGAHAEAIDGVASTLRQSLVAKAQAQTHSTQARASALVLTCMPLAITGPMVVFDSSTRGFLFGTSIGLFTLAAGLGFDGLGAFWMAKMIKRVTL